MKDLIPPGINYIADNIVTKHNILGAPKEAGAKWAKNLGLSRKADTIFFAGCGYQYESNLEAMMSIIRKLDKSKLGAELPMGLAGLQKKVGVDFTGVYRKFAVKENDTDAIPLIAAVKVLRNYGVDIGYLAEEEPCCGGLLHYAGLEDKFNTHVNQTYARLKSAEVKRIISIVPSCTYTIRNLMPRYIDNFDIEVKHFLEVVVENLHKSELRYPEEIKVVYHDPCQLSRYLGFIDEPRQILRAIKGIELVDITWAGGEWSTCCGGGGGFEAVFPELSHILAVNRARELVETGAQMIVTHCPGCSMQLKEGLRELQKGDIRVLDIAEILATAMGV
jgi:Fe-S oxidoreductase